MLAFIPSSLMMSVTNCLSTDIAAIPLLWIIPLSIYLLSFILVFSRRPPLAHLWMVKAMPIFVLPLMILLIIRGTDPIKIVIPLHLVAFFLIAMVCHGELSRDRPPAEHLTAFYLFMSLGGVLGGIFNALLAPLIFDSFAEYPIIVALACSRSSMGWPLVQIADAHTRHRFSGGDWVCNPHSGIGPAEVRPANESTCCRDDVRFACHHFIFVFPPTASVRSFSGGDLSGGYVFCRESRAGAPGQAVLFWCDPDHSR